MGIKSFRQKGQQAEYEVRDMLQSIVDEAVAVFVNEYPQNSMTDMPKLIRNLEQRREGGSDLQGLDWAAIEVKRQEDARTAKQAQWWLQTITAAAKKGPDGKVACEKNGNWIFEREPILLWKQNFCPWRVKMMAWVSVGSNTSEYRDRPLIANGRMRVSAEIDYELFVDWFRLKTLQELVRKYVEGSALPQFLRQKPPDPPSDARFSAKPESKSPSLELEHMDHLYICSECRAGEHDKCRANYDSETECDCTSPDHAGDLKTEG